MQRKTKVATLIRIRSLIKNKVLRSLRLVSIIA